MGAQTSGCDTDCVLKTGLFTCNVSAACSAEGQIGSRLALMSLLSLWLPLNDVRVLCRKSLFSL